jgi:hypothetical protein
VAAAEVAVALARVDGSMPSLFRFFGILLVLAAVAAAAMIYLGTFVTPHTREMSAPIPAERLRGI